MPLYESVKISDAAQTCSREASSSYQSEFVLSQKIMDHVCSYLVLFIKVVSVAVAMVYYWVMVQVVEVFRFLFILLKVNYSYIMGSCEVMLNIVDVFYL